MAPNGGPGTKKKMRARKLNKTYKGGQLRSPQQTLVAQQAAAAARARLAARATPKPPTPAPKPPTPITNPLLGKYNGLNPVIISAPGKFKDQTTFPAGKYFKNPSLFKNAAAYLTAQSSYTAGQAAKVSGPKPPTPAINPLLGKYSGPKPVTVGAGKFQDQTPFPAGRYFKNPSSFRTASQYLAAEKSFTNSQTRRASGPSAATPVTNPVLGKYSGPNPFKVTTPGKFKRGETIPIGKYFENPATYQTATSYLNAEKQYLNKINKTTSGSVASPGDVTSTTGTRNPVLGNSTKDILVTAAVQRSLYPPGNFPVQGVDPAQYPNARSYPAGRYRDGTPYPAGTYYDDPSTYPSSTAYQNGAPTIRTTSTGTVLPPAGVTGGPGGIAFGTGRIPVGPGGIPVRIPSGTGGIPGRIPVGPGGIPGGIQADEDVTPGALPPGQVVEITEKQKIGEILEGGAYETFDHPSLSPGHVCADFSRGGRFFRVCGTPEDIRQAIADFEAPDDADVSDEIMRAMAALQDAQQEIAAKRATRGGRRRTKKISRRKLMRRR